MNGPLLRLSIWLARRRTTRDEPAARNEPLDDGIGTDDPIGKASADRLRRTKFAHRIAGVLSELSLRQGKVFAICGGWGFGKSSLKNLITEQLDARKDGADWLDFNPWQWGNGDAIARALFSQIADRLGGEHSAAALESAEKLRRYGLILTGASAPLKEVEGSTLLFSTVLTNASVIAVASAIGFSLSVAAEVAAILAGVSLVASLLGRLLRHLGRDRSDEPLYKVRASLEARLRQLDRPLVVFVDDIDRLEPEQIRILLRQVKANANLPNIVFVLLFQRSIVENALEPVAEGHGRDFLEKIVQAAFDLPAVPVSIVHRIFREELSELVTPYATETNGFSQTRWWNTFIDCIQPFLRNIRDSRRLISSIAVHIPLHASDNVFEVNIVDFLILEALRVFEPNLHEQLFRERELVLQEGLLLGDGQQETHKKAAEMLLECASEKHRVTAREAIKELFPLIEWAFGGTRYENGFHRKWLNEKRVCSPRYFPRYFELQTQTDEISERRFVSFLEATATENKFYAAIEDIEADGLLLSLVTRLDESTDRLPIENAAIILPGMFFIAEKFSSSSNVDPFNSPWVSAWRATSSFLKQIPDNKRDELAIEALCKTEALSIAAILIRLNDPADYEDSQKDTFVPALDLKTVEKMKKQWLQLIEKRAKDVDTLLAKPNLIFLLYQWIKLAGSSEEPRKWIEQAIKTDEGFAIIISRMMNIGTTHVLGDHVSTLQYNFDEKMVEKFIGIDVAKARCDSIDPTRFPEHKEALQQLHISLEQWLGIKETDETGF